MVAYLPVCGTVRGRITCHSVTLEFCAGKFGDDGSVADDYDDDGDVGIQGGSQPRADVSHEPLVNRAGPALGVVPFDLNTMYNC